MGIFDLSVEKLQGYGLVLLLSNIYKDKDGFFLYVFFVYERNKFAKIGRVTMRLGNSPDIQYLGNIGYFIAKKHRGKNYATNACNILFNYLKIHGINKVNITVDLDNKASQRVCEKLGGVQSGLVKHGNNVKIVYTMSFARGVC
ncbi:MAG: GNAT family N-acetyltransferase [Defluviitaleaceae bacterium]|nr:GNAT family N-acetyltransferase [Defluviitaleaceae bacterium]